jgi:murein DD-endopeptidase MepM/ murein hydrolase activator NlpD
MRRALVLAAVVAAVAAGAARADTFAVLPPTTTAGAPAVPVVPVALASPEVPNPAGAVTALPFGGVAQQLDYPQLVSIWQRAGATYGVPWQVLGAINKVESNFGRNMGPSSAGAIGWMQFMPSTWERWGVDANQDGIADPWNAEDAITSAARYLAAAGGQTDIKRAIFSYNHADWYVNEVLSISKLFGSAGAGATFQLDQMQESLASAQQDLADAASQLAAAQRIERAIDRVYERRLAKVSSARLLSDQLAAQRRAVLTGVRRDRAAAAVAQAQALVDKARTALDRARTDSQAASFSPGAGTLLGAPAYDGGWVFPVGGGPSLVSVSHFHHDYPAADIAAPEGSPVYALAHGVVTELVDDSLCGTGFEYQTGDGQTWVYCHLSYRDPTVQVGQVFDAGASVGLVGHTGSATGPHLHLGLKPSTYPQDQAWFQSFAGVAFTWQDAAPPGRAVAAAETTVRTGDVFAVMPSRPAPQQAPAQAPAIGFTLQGG